MTTLAIDTALVPCLDYSPERMLLSSERRQVTDILRRLNAARDSGRQALSQRAAEQRLHRVATLNNQLSELARSVWKREVGLEQFTVLSVRPSFRSADVRLMVENVRIDQWANKGQLHWEFRGNRLRKDWLVGTLTAYTTFREAAIARRHLSGQWESLRVVREEAA